MKTKPPKSIYVVMSRHGAHSCTEYHDEAESSRERNQQFYPDLGEWKVQRYVKRSSFFDWLFGWVK